MKTLEVYKKQQLLEKIPLTKDTILIGRSPVCDVVLRKKNIKQVHYSLQKIAESDNELWTLFENEPNDNNHTGIMLGKDKATLGDLEFCLSEDSLQETNFKKGGLVQSLSLDKKETKLAQNLLLEVISINNELNSIRNIFHFSKSNHRYKCFPNAPDLFLLFTPKFQLSLYGIKKTANYKFFVNNFDVTDKVLTQTKFEFIYTDQILIQTKEVDYLIRFVKKENFSLTKKSFLNDDLVKILILVFMTVMGLYILVKVNPPPKPKIEASKARIIKIVKPKFEPPPPVEIIKEVTPTIQTLEIKPKTVEKPVILSPKPIDPPKEISELKPNITKPKYENKIKSSEVIKSKAKSSTGLLGFLKKNQRSNQKQDNSLVENALTSKEVTDTNITIPSSNLGDSLAKKSHENTGKSGLQGVESDINNEIRTGQIVIDKNKNKFSDFKNNNLGKSLLRSLENSQNGELSISGSLTKESVRNKLKLHNNEFLGCYQNALIKKSTIEGEITFSWMINNAGKVTSLTLVSSAINDHSFESCIEEVIENITFESSKDGNGTNVTYPIRFKGG